MKTDSYTKIILTIIAVCLTVNVLKDLEIIPSAHAKNNEVNVPALQSGSTIDVRIVGWTGLKYDPIPVIIK